MAAFINVLTFVVIFVMALLMAPGMLNAHDTTTNLAGAILLVMPAVYLIGLIFFYRSKS